MSVQEKRGGCCGRKHPKGDKSSSSPFVSCPCGDRFGKLDLGDICATCEPKLRHHQGPNYKYLTKNKPLDCRRPERDCSVECVRKDGVDRLGAEDKE